MEKNTCGLFFFRRRNCASILVISIWTMVFFSILCLGLYSICSSQINLARRFEERLICQAMAKSAVVYFQASQRIKKTTFEGLYELSRKVQKEMLKGKFIYTLTDEESKINLNTSSAQVLERIFQVDTRVANNILSSHLRPYSLKEELLLVDGMEGDVFERGKNFITTYSTGKVNINTAPIEVLTALGLDAGLAEEIIDFRAGADLKEATEDDNVFENSGEVIGKLASFVSLSDAQRKVLGDLINQGVFTTDSRNYSMYLETFILNRPAMKYNLVVTSDGIKRWQEY